MDDFKDRIEKVEDSLAFNERHQDEISEQLIKAYQAIEKLSARIESLEARLGAVEAPLEDPGDEVPGS